jgi:acyl dehydratase
MSQDAAQTPSAAQPEFRGRTFDEFRAGDVVRSRERVLTQADIAAFAELSGDHNPAHVDEAYARRSAFRGTIAHGMLVQSVASGLAYQTGVFDGTVVAFVEMWIRFEAPARPGARVHLELTVTDKDAEPGPKRGKVRFRSRVLDDAGTVLIDGDWVLLVARSVDARNAAVRRVSGPE